MRTQPEGKYDALAEAMLVATEAQCAVVIIVGGRLGNGFSVAMHERYRLIADKLPAILRTMADEIEAQRKAK